MGFYTFNVGGEQFCISKATIEACQPNYFALVVQRNPDEQVHFLDRDPKLFRYVLLFLRQYSNPLPESETDLINLKDDAMFYGLQPLVSMINSKLSDLSSTQEVIPDKPEPSWAKDALLVQYKNSMKDAIQFRKELHGETMSELESEKFIRDHLQMDEFALDRDDISSWPSSALKSAIEKLETIGKRFQMAACLKLYQEYTFRSLMGAGMVEQEAVGMDALPSPANLEEIALKMSKKNVDKYSWVAMIGKKIMEMLKVRAEADRRRWEGLRIEPAPWINNLVDGEDLVPAPFEQPDGERTVLLDGEPPFRLRQIRRERIVRRCPYETTTVFRPNTDGDTALVEEREQLENEINNFLNDENEHEEQKENDDENKEQKGEKDEEDAIIEDVDE